MTSAYSQHDEVPEFWFNLKTGGVEVGRLSPSPDRVGPFLTQAEAVAALQLIKSRTQSWKDEEERD